MKKILFSVIAIAAAAGFATSSAAQGGLALGAKVGTLGPGVELTGYLVGDLNIRAGFNYLPYSYEFEEDGINYDADLTMQSALILLDWHMFGNNFRFSAGLTINDNILEVTGATSEPEEIGNSLYTPAEIGTLKGRATFDQLAPYVGIGYGNAVADDVALSFVFDLGIIFQGTPDIDLSSSGTMASDPQFQADLKEEEQNIQDEADSFKIYPVLAFGIAYYFW
ncbi:MAG: hypothetical protein V1929_04585 [bacterium]